MNLRTILFSQYPALFLLAVLFLIAHLRVRKTSAVKSVLWVILFGAALAASVVCCFLGIQAELWTLKTLITLGFWSWFGVGLVLLFLVLLFLHGLGLRLGFGLGFRLRLGLLGFGLSLGLFGGGSLHGVGTAHTQRCTQYGCGCCLGSSLVVITLLFLGIVASLLLVADGVIVVKHSGNVL